MLPVDRRIRVTSWLLAELHHWQSTPCTYIHTHTPTITRTPTHSHGERCSSTFIMYQEISHEAFSSLSSGYTVSSLIHLFSATSAECWMKVLSSCSQHMYFTNGTHWAISIQRQISRYWMPNGMLRIILRYRLANQWHSYSICSTDWLLSTFRRNFPTNNVIG